MIVYFMCFARLPYRNADGIDEDNEDLDQLRAEISAWAGIDDEQRVRSDLPDKLYRSLKRLLAINPDERPATEEILHVLKSPSVFDEFNAYAGPSGMDDFSPRISRADSPSPGPAHMTRKRSSAHPYTRPGRSNLGASVMERSPSPPPAQIMRRTSSEEAAMVLRSKNLDFPPPEVVRTPSPQRLMLPPPPTENQGRLYQYRHRVVAILQSPPILSLVRVTLFFMKVASLFGSCQPFAAEPWAAYSLLGLASLDFLYPHVVVLPCVRRWYTGGLIGSVVLMLVHIAIVSVLWRNGRLCARSITWEGF